MTEEVEEERTYESEEVEERVYEKHRLITPDKDVANPTDLYHETGFIPALKHSIRSPYILANIIYVLYAILIINIDIHDSVYDTSTINAMYFGANIIHLTNAFMYMWVWWNEGFRGRRFAILLIPEILNCMEATLYITSSSFYNSEGNEWPCVPYDNSTYNDYIQLSNASSNACNLTNGDVGMYVFVPDPVTDNVQNIEMTASVLAMIAAIGWTITWWLTYRRVPGRGWTLDDPDVWALSTILVGDIMYIIYNSEIINNRTTYGSNTLYATADWVFLVNSFCYLACSLRDAGWFYFLPTAGRFRFNTKYVLVHEPDPSNIYMKWIPD